MSPLICRAGRGGSAEPDGRPLPRRHADAPDLLPGLVPGEQGCGTMNESLECEARLNMGNALKLGQCR